MKPNSSVNEAGWLCRIFVYLFINISICNPFRALTSERGTYKWLCEIIDNHYQETISYVLLRYTSECQEMDYKSPQVSWRLERKNKEQNACKKNPKITGKKNILVSIHLGGEVLLLSFYFLLDNINNLHPSISSHFGFYFDFKRSLVLTRKSRITQLNNALFFARKKNPVSYCREFFCNENLQQSKYNLFFY